MDCGFALSMIARGTAYPSSNSDGTCLEISGGVYCGSYQRVPDVGVVFQGKKFDPNAYLISLFSVSISPFDLSGASSSPAEHKVSVQPKDPKIDWNKMANDCVHTYGFTNPGRPPSGLNPSGIESIVYKNDQITLVDQLGKPMKSFTMGRGPGPGGFGGSVGL
jgi:hypothetical protein